MAGWRRAAITGGPGAGKTTLVAQLARRGFATADEVARVLLRQAGGMELRARQPLEFAQAMLEAQLATWDAQPESGVPTIHDRGFADIVGFLRLEGLPVPAAIDRACRELRFDGPVFRAPAWQAIYRADAQRTQDWHEARESDRAVASAWRDYGYELVDLPLAGIGERADFVIARL